MLKEATHAIEPLGCDPRRITLVYIHVFTNSAAIDDDHPTAYLHWAGLVPQRVDELAAAEREGRDGAKVRTLQKIVKRAVANLDRLRLGYAEARADYLKAYISQVEATQPPFDLVVCCPSTRDDARFYGEGVMDMARCRNREANDLSGAFSKDPSFRAGAACLTKEEAAKHIRFSYEGRLPPVSRVLIVDDVWARGTTVTAVVGHLCAAGLQADLPVTVFAPLWVPEGGKQKRTIDGCEY